MRLSIELVKLRGWPPLRRALFAALALALAGGVLPVHAEGPDVQLDTGMDIDFHTSTPPIRKGVICVGKDYMIIPRPFVRSLNIPYDHPLNKSHYPWHWYQARVDVSSALIGTIVPPFHFLSQLGVSQPWAYPAVFSYRSARTGHEKLEFTAKTPGLSGIKFSMTPNQDPKDYTTGWFHSTKEKFEFEVVNCGYELTFLWSTQYVGLVSSVTVGLMDETRLERQEDGTYKGSGSFVFKITNAVPSCVSDFKDIETLLRITGKLLPNSDELELNFDYGTGKLEATFTCSGGGGGKASGPWDISPFAPKTVKFPQEGGSKSFPINKWFRDETGNLTIIVTREEAAELGVGG